ncbi:MULTISPECIES: PrsW family intramembrane metalloprotease [unclassified Pseudoclavibacter]|uniref:PrsW family intramembrane metalloprotease n=1 Tax=unclassified Pseudoclavibacter TaxID=2615177 RepID=UPI0015E3F705|nr:MULTISPECIES: PrsW family intramembrane metalloprotease [unclassified Pseudoclavibacter]MBF4549565.1 PrsW family intramembrane metalloprotease [Pseudoclavibacter sp. VKM Ac-2888]
MSSATSVAPKRRRRLTRGRLTWLLLLGFAVLLSVGVVAWLFSELRFAALTMAIPALVPLGLVLTAVWWLDRWEPEPRILLAFGLFWGAGASVVGTLVTGGMMLDVARSYLATEGAVSKFSVLIQSPISEESIKAVGLFLILIFARRHFDSPLDGFSYAAVIGAGFAFTENIIYFSQAAESASGFASTFIVRGILSPFAHALFTGITGMAIGWGARRGGWRRPILMGLGGLVIAILAHAFWNGGSLLILPLLGVDPSNQFGWLIFYLVVQLPIFLLLAWFLVKLHDRDRLIIVDRLGEYADAGWFTTSEVAMIGDWSAREQAFAWAKSVSPEADRAMRGFVQDASRLAFAREHARVNKRDPNRRVVEKRMLDRVKEHRSQLAAFGAAGPRVATS